MSWTTRAADFCLAIAPEIGRANIIDAETDVATARFLPPGCVGVTSAILPFALHRSAGTRDVDARRGFACVIAPNQIWPTPLLPHLLTFVSINVALHELAHHLTFCSLHASLNQLAGKELDLSLPSLEQIAAMGSPLPTPAEPWEMHESQFTRACLNIVHRANVAGFNTNINNLTVAGERYGLSRAARYGEALGDEPEALADVPISEILLTPAPAAFLDLFARDCAAWHAAQRAAT